MEAVSKNLLKTYRLPGNVSILFMGGNRHS